MTQKRRRAALLHKFSEFEELLLERIDLGP